MRRAFSWLNRNFFILWQGQMVSRMGDQAFSIVRLFFVKRATGSATILGLMQMVIAASIIILAPFSGVVADRFSRRNVILFCDFMRGVLLLLLVGLFFFFPDQKVMLVVATVFIGMFVTSFSVFFGSAFSASIPELVPRDRVANAQGMGQLSKIFTMVGQGLGGVLYLTIGPMLLILLDAFSFLYAAGSDSLVTIPQTFRERRAGEAGKQTMRGAVRSFRLDITEGLRYIFQNPGIKAAVYTSIFLAFFSTPIMILLPFYIEDVLKVPLSWYGFFIVATGIGNIIGMVIITTLTVDPKLRGRLILLFLVLEGAGFSLLAVIRDPMQAMALAAIGGITDSFVSINIMSIIQVTVPSELRGRVLSLLTTITASIVPVGMGLSGIIADATGQNIPAIYMATGLIIAGLVILFGFNRDFRQFLQYKPEPGMVTGMAARRLGARQAGE